MRSVTDIRPLDAKGEWGGFTQPEKVDAILTSFGGVAAVSVEVKSRRYSILSASEANLSKAIAEATADSPTAVVATLSSRKALILWPKVIEVVSL